MITDKSRYGHDAVLDLNCGDSVQVLRTEPMTLTEQEQKIVQKYLGIALLEKSYIDANGHLMVVLSDGRTLDVGSARGLSGATPYLGENGNWFVEGVDTLQSARGLPGFTPYIGENEHWWIDETDTGIPARGIPLTEKADNTRFLRNDGTWQKVTPENIGAAKQSVVADHESRIEALEQRTVTAPYYTDDSVAYIKEVPENALPFASVDKVGGMTRKCANLIPYPYQGTTKTENGITFKDNGDGTITLNGTATGQANFYFRMYYKLSAGTYHLRGIPNIVGNSADGCIIYINDLDFKHVATDSGAGSSFTLKEDKQVHIRIIVYEGISVSNAVVRPMLNEGAEPLPYEPYFDGLRSAPVTEVESVGVNLWSGEILAQSAPTTYTFDAGTMTLTRNGGGIQAFVWGKEKYKAGTYNLSFDLSGTDAGANFRILKTKTPSATNIGVDIRSLYSNGTHIIAFTLTEDGYIGFGTDADNVKLTASNIMLNKGSTALPYTPYRSSDTLPIPAEVQALDGYGWGINDKVYNYIDWEKKQFVKRVVKKVFDGTEKWVGGGNTGTNNAYYIHRVDEFGAVVSYIGVCNRYDRLTITGSTTDVGFSVINSSGYESAIISVRPENAETMSTTRMAELCKAWHDEGNPLTVYYGLAAPVITDISDLLPDDNLIRVEGGCNVTMVNEYGYDVPSKITYARLTWQ